MDNMANIPTTVTPSFTWVKRVTEIGLTLMTPKAAKERMEGILDGDTINTPKLIALINECVAVSGIYVEKHDDRIKASDAELIQSLLGRTDAERVLQGVNPDELAAWVKDLVAAVAEKE